ncbi:MAG: hypothetical protein AUK35_06285 [Zetaproteobacteria bacterium CG2_30_46_52]|nr:MAG: hypothetical protein AUK35_06285 [Zetaproteobacteria bacterium CG2_30_46_52]
MTPSDQWLYKFKRKSGWVFVPTPDTLAYGKEIKVLIEKRWKAPAYYYHLRQGGHVAALQQHSSNEYFLHLDIKSFFGHINATRITRCLKGMFSYVKAREIAIHSTVHHPKAKHLSILPFGFVQSPIIASVCLRMSTLGNCLHELHKQAGMEVSVYMDDIILSSNNLDDLKKALEKVEQASERSILPLNKKKQEGPDRMVTAFNIKLSRNNLDITAERLGEFQSIYHASPNPNQKAGILHYVKTVNASQAAMF